MTRIRPGGSVNMAALSTTFARQAQGRPASSTWVALGDSITAFNNGGGTYGQIDGYYHRFLAKSLGRIVKGAAYATSGMTLEQIESTHLPTVLALDPAPGACIVFGGTNNTGANSGAGAGTGYNKTTARATHKRIRDALRNAGIVPILVMIPPRGDATLAAQNVSDWNQYIYAVSQAEGLPVMDAFTPLVDPATGGYLAGLSTDSVHPTARGHEAIAAYAITQELHKLAPPAFPHPGLWADPLNLVSGGQGLFLTNSGGLGTGWSASGTGTNVTTQIVAPTAADNLKGNWQQITQAVGGTGQRWIQRQITSGWSVGDELLVSFRVQAEGFTGNGVTAQYDTWGVLPLPGTTGAGGYQWSANIDGLVRQRIVVPGTATSLYSRFIVNGSTGLTQETKLRIGEVTVRNLTTGALLAV